MVRLDTPGDYLVSFGGRRGEMIRLILFRHTVNSIRMLWFNPTQMLVNPVQTLQLTLSRYLWLTYSAAMVNPI